MVACCFMFCATPRSALRLDLRVELRRPCDSDAIHKSLQGKKSEVTSEFRPPRATSLVQILFGASKYGLAQSLQSFWRSQNDVENEGRNNRKVTHPGKVSRSTTGVLIVRYRSRAHPNATRLLSCGFYLRWGGSGAVAFVALNSYIETQRRPPETANSSITERARVFCEVYVYCVWFVIDKI